VGGVLDGIIGASAVTFIAAGGFALDAVIAFFWLPETRNKIIRTEFSWRRANPFGGIWLLASDSVTLRVMLLEVGTMVGLCGACTRFYRSISASFAHRARH
jgi:hypothetical protein